MTLHLRSLIALAAATCAAAGLAACGGSSHATSSRPSTSAKAADAPTTAAPKAATGGAAPTAAEKQWLAAVQSSPALIAPHGWKPSTGTSAVTTINRPVQTIGLGLGSARAVLLEVRCSHTTTLHLVLNGGQAKLRLKPLVCRAKGSSTAGATGFSDEPEGSQQTGPVKDDVSYGLTGTLSQPAAVQIALFVPKGTKQ